MKPPGSEVRRLGRPGAGLVVAAAYLSGHVGSVGFPKGVPAEAWQWLLPLALACAGLSLLERARLSPRLRWGLRLALSFWTAWVTFKGRNPLVLTAVAAGMLAWFWLLERLAERPGPTPFLLVLVIVGVGSSLALLLSGSILLAQLCVAPTVALGACFLASMRYGLPSYREVMPVAGVLLPGLCLNGILYAEMPVLAALFLAGAPLGVCLLEAAPLDRLRPWQALLLRSGTAALFAGCGVAVALLQSPPLES